MNIFSVSVIGLLAVVASLTIKQYNKEISVLLTAAAVTVISCLLIPNVIQIVASIKDISALVSVSDTYISALIKSLGICYITEFSSQICRDNGSSSVACQIEFAGKIVILGLAVPIYSDIIEMVSNFL